MSQTTKTSDEEFPPKVPCPEGTCAYGDECGGPCLSDMGCGGCCRCYRTCHLEYDISQVYIPETPEQYKLRLQADALWKNFKPVRFT